MERGREVGERRGVCEGRKSRERRAGVTCPCNHLLTWCAKRINSIHGDRGGNGSEILVVTEVVRCFSGGVVAVVSGLAAYIIVINGSIRREVRCY